MIIYYYIYYNKIIILIFINNNIIIRNNTTTRKQLLTGVMLRYICKVHSISLYDSRFSRLRNIIYYLSYKHLTNNYKRHWSSSAQNDKSK